MERCSLDHPETCITDHLCPKLSGLPRPGGNGWRAPCPVCGGDLSLDVGKWYRVVWSCRGGEGCDGVTVKKAMLAAPYRISPGCIPWSGRPRESSVKPRESHASFGEDSRVLDELGKYLSEKPNPIDFMIHVAALVWDDVDERSAAMRAGIANGTYYRHRAKK